MTAELERLIRLQKLEDAAATARAQIEQHPARLAALDARADARRRAVDDAKTRIAEQKTARQAFEKELAEVQPRLNRFKDQMMTVKTNKEYTAMQHEISRAEQEVQRLEDVILEKMLEGDELAARGAAVERELADEQSAVSSERAEIEGEHRELEAQLAKHNEARAALASQIEPQHLSLFDLLTRQRKGVAVDQARDGRCASCQVRLRPQLFNDIRSNSSLIQCESCQRILYYAPEQAPTTK